MPCWAVMAAVRGAKPSAAAGALLPCTAAPALAGSVTQPGETVGLATRAPLNPGWYANQYRGLGLQEHGSHHSGRRLVNAVDDFGRETTVPGGRGLRWKSACTTSAMGFEVLWILHSIIPNELCKRPTGYVQ